jgi:hypothetical protein
MENLKGMWNFAYDWNSTGQFYIVRLVIKNNGRFQFPDFGRVGGRWAKLDGNIIMKINNNIQTSYSGMTTGHVMLGMIEEQYTEVPLSAVGTWMAFKTDAKFTVISSYDYFVSRRSITKKKWRRGMAKPFSEADTRDNG